jgi:hypothetical protein
MASTSLKALGFLSHDFAGLSPCRQGPCPRRAPSGPAPDTSFQPLHLSSRSSLGEREAIASIKTPCGPNSRPLDLEVIDRVYEAAWAQLPAMNLPRDEMEELDRQKNLRKRLFALARAGGVEFDTLCDMVLASYSPKVTPFGTYVRR